MIPEDQRALDALRLTIRASHTLTADAVPAVIHAAGRALGAHRATAWLVDYDQVVLTPFGPGRGRSDALAVDSSPAGAAFRGAAVQRVTEGEFQTVWVPMIDGTARIGALQLTFPVESSVGDAACCDLAAVTTDLLLTKSRYGDAIEAVRRRRPLSLSAEIGWPLMPPPSFVTDAVSLAAVMVPATKIAGDAFDYAVDDRTLAVSILDAMGHSLDATLMAAVAAGALRNGRRQGRSLTEIVRDADTVIQRQFGAEQFVTGIIGQLDLPTGAWTWITCGHPPALIVREGHVVHTLDSVVAPPLGLGLIGRNPDSDTHQLQAGDRILLYTDGVTEARDRYGEQFGIDRLAHLAGRESTADRLTAEALRKLNVAILAHQHGVLQDDATTVLIEWRPPTSPDLTCP